jgi:hypothetical protein
LPIPSIAPDFKFRFIARRLELLDLLYNGTLPEAMAAELLASNDQGQEKLAEMLTLADEQRQKLSGAEQAKLLAFQKQAAVAVCVAPKLVDGPARNPGEVSLPALPGAGKLIVALFGYAMSLSPGVPVKLTNGKETTLDGVRSFRDKSALPDAGSDGPQSEPRGQQLDAHQG